MYICIHSRYLPRSRSTSASSILLEGLTKQTVKHDRRQLSYPGTERRYHSNLEGLHEGVNGLHGGLCVSGNVVGHGVRRPVLLEVGLEAQQLPASLHETLVVTMRKTRRIRGARAHKSAKTTCESRLHDITVVMFMFGLCSRSHTDCLETIFCERLVSSFRGEVQPFSHLRAR